jgi:hypothetical protein
MKIRSRIELHSVPDAFPDNTSGAGAIKLLVQHFRHDDTRNSLKNDEEVTFYCDKLVLDLDGLDPGEIDVKTAAKDCDIVKRALDNPEAKDRITDAIISLKKGSIEGIKKANAAIESLGLSEVAVVKAGGGAIMLLLALAVVVLTSCSDSCGNTAHGQAAGAEPMKPAAGPR